MIVVLGSINLDIVMRPTRLPGPGETVLAPGYAMFPGGKGANQALAARRAGAEVAMVGCVGDDDFAVQALATMREAGVDLSGISTVAGATGAAAIAVDDNGENQIVVASGTNQSVSAARFTPSPGDWLLLQMEIPHAANWEALAAARAAGMRTALNLAPAADIPETALANLDVLIANQIEAETLARQHRQPVETVAVWIAGTFELDCIVTLGGAGARAALRDGTQLKATALPIEPLDTTAAGDAFVGAYVATLYAGQGAADALRHAIAAGSLACTAEGAQPSLPDAAAIKAAAGRVEVSPA
ncbi:MAG: ribokinase [Alphaproteobacteria bacterium]